MEDIVKNLIYLLFGALLTIAGTSIQSRRDRNWHLEDAKRESKKNAENQRLAEAEEYAKSTLADFGYMLEAGRLVVMQKRSKSQEKQLETLIQQRIENHNRLDKRVFIGASALRSLDIPALNQAWESMLENYEVFDSFVINQLFEVLKPGTNKTSEDMQELQIKFNDKRWDFIKSVDELFRQINKVRSQN